MQFTSTTGFAARATHRDGMVVVALAGDLDIDAVGALDAFLRSLEPLPDVVALNVNDLQFIDGAGLRLLLAEQERALSGGHRLVLFGAQGIVLSTMQLVALDDVVAIAPASGV